MLKAIALGLFSYYHYIEISYNKEMLGKEGKRK